MKTRVNGMSGDLWLKACTLRLAMEQCWSSETCQGNFDSSVPSKGQCAVTAILANRLFGWDIVSAKVDGVSHWFNSCSGMDIDVTGDQFGREAVAVDRSGIMWPDSYRVRCVESDVNDETKARVVSLILTVGMYRSKN